MTGKLLPCYECGVDLWDLDCEETTATVGFDMGRKLFGQTKAEREVPAWVCPECETVNPL